MRGEEETLTELMENMLDMLEKKLIILLVAF